MFTADQDPRWAALVTRDRAADGQFYYSVATTGVYCRPSCAARPAKPQNVRFHDTPADAERAGFRACKRCKPDQPREVIGFAVAPCAVGAVLVAMNAKGICAILLGDDADAVAREIAKRFPHARPAIDARLAIALAKVVALIEAPGPAPDLPLDPHGTPFQLRVWRALRAIPPGATASYADIAARVGAPKSVRAVAQACGANPLAVVVPCHRVVRSDRGLSGYRWGVARKRALLAREAA